MTLVREWLHNAYGAAGPLSSNVSGNVYEAVTDIPVPDLSRVVRVLAYGGLWAQGLATGTTPGADLSDLRLRPFFWTSQIFWIPDGGIADTAHRAEGVMDWSFDYQGFEQTTAISWRNSQVLATHRVSLPEVNISRSDGSRVESRGGGVYRWRFNFQGQMGTTGIDDWMEFLLDLEFYVLTEHN